MRFERMASLVRGKRTAAIAAVLLLVLAGGIVALVDDGGGRGSNMQTVGSDLPTPAVAPASGTAGSTAEGKAAAGGGRAAADMGAPVASGSGGSVAGAPVAPGSPSFAVADKGGTKVVKTANLRVQVDKGGFRSAFDRAAAVAGRYNGFVASSSEATQDKNLAEGTLTIRVPADQFDAARRDLAGLGKVDHQELGGQDVTAQVVDYDARIRSLQAQEQALSTLLSKARTVGEVLEVQGQLFNVRQQIEQLQSQRSSLDAQATMSTITTTVFEPGAVAAKPTPQPATGLAHSWDRAWDGAIAVVGGMVIVVGYLLPLALLALLGWVVWRLTQRRRPAPAAS
jgi:hypothetical protein